MTLQPPDDILQAIRQAHRTAITAHARPDGDALGSALGLCRILRADGLTADVVGLTDVPQRYAFLPREGEIVAADPERLREYDLLIVLDCASPERLPEQLRDLPNDLRTVVIDHHASNRGFGSTNWIEPQASSVGELLCCLAEQGNLAIPADAADALYTAIMTDTGRFCFENTGSGSLRAAGSLVRAGAQPAYLATRIYQSRTLTELRVLQQALQSLEVLCDGRLAVVSLSREDFSRLQATPQDAEDVIDLPRSLRGVEVAAFLYEPPDRQETKISLRAKEPHDAAIFCAGFGGGGHARAAGCQLTLPIDQARRAIAKAIADAWFPDCGTPFASERQDG